MKKKLLTILLSVFMIMGTFTTRVFAEWTSGGTGTQGDPWKIGAAGNEANVTAYIDGTTLHIKGSGAMQDFDFAPWGTGNDITAIDIGSGITNIGDYCFNSLFSITEAIVPNGVIKIGERAFNSCINLEEITLPETVTEIGEYAFCSVKASANIIIKATTPPILSNKIVYYSGSDKYYVYVPSSSIKEYNNNASWKNNYLLYASNNFIKPIVSNINDALGFADGDFPLSSESAPSNAWINANGAKVYKTTSAIVFEKGSDKLTFDLNSEVVEGDEKYTYSSGGISLEFNVDEDYSFMNIILTNTSSDLDGIYYDPTSIAVALTKANGGFPTTSTDAWLNDNDKQIYESNNCLCLYFDEEMPLCKIYEKLDNENKYVLEEIVTIKFNIVDNKLSSITISGMPNPYNAANGTYAASTPTPTPDTEPDPEPTPRYKIPNTGVEGTYSNNHSLLKLSSLSLLAVGTYLVIKKKKDN